ncbi:MAG TPA: Na+/H+ antiporter NhaA [Terriglobales bacterium]|nr:Na+/H+ antiporter NhaA [Terriglobales bacterium]
MTRRSHAPHPRPFQRFFQTEAAGSVLLLLSAFSALIAANSPWAGAYQRLWSIPLTIGIPNQSLSLMLHRWVSDGLMAVFFLHVGLEIKRELVAGELSSPRQAALPIAGAVGGMVLPAAIYLLVNHSGVEARGWGIPMATDIAFALGTLTLIAPTIPVGAKVFLTALAIVDDMGAVVVIALFYTHALNWTALILSGLTLGALLTLNVTRVGRLAPYLLLGALLWLFMHESGIHSTIAGVLLAFTIPTRTRINADEFSTEARVLLDEFERTETGDYLVLTSKGQQDALFSLGRASEAVTAPLLRLEHALHTFSAFVIMPLFAFSNAGVSIGGSVLDWSVILGVTLGLALGKPLGITGAAAAAVVGDVAAVPRGVRWSALHGCAWVGGIGFTMSLFIANLAFEGTPLLDSAKVGILAGSVVAVLVGGIVIRVSGSGAVGEHE